MYGRSLNLYVYAQPFKQGPYIIYERENYATVEIYPWDSPFGVERDDTTNIRDFKIPRRQWQWKRQKSNRLNRQNNNFARASRFFVHFFAVPAPLRRENA